MELILVIRFKSQLQNQLEEDDISTQDEFAKEVSLHLSLARSNRHIQLPTIPNNRNIDIFAIEDRIHDLQIPINDTHLRRSSVFPVGETERALVGGIDVLW